MTVLEDVPITPRKGMDGRALSFGELLELSLSAQKSDQPSDAASNRDNQSSPTRRKDAAESAWNPDEDYSILTEVSVDPLATDRLAIREQWKSNVAEISDSLKNFEILESRQVSRVQSPGSTDDAEESTEFEGPSQYNDIDSHDVSAIEPHIQHDSFALSEYEFSRLIDSSFLVEKEKSNDEDESVDEIVVEIPEKVNVFEDNRRKTFEPKQPALIVSRPPASVINTDSFREMNAQLQKLSEQHETALRRFNEEKSAFEKRKQVEIESMKKFFTEERNKLEIERRNISKQFKLNQMLPSKTERHEIEALKLRIVELEECIKTKDVKSRLTVDRLKKQVEDANKRISELMSEVKVLEGERLTWMTGSRDNTNVSDSVKLGSSKLGEKPRPQRPPKPIQNAHTRVASDSKDLQRGKVISQQTFVDGRSELTYSDNSIVIRYPNGSVKETKDDGTMIIIFGNGDKKTVCPDGTCEYYYADSGVRQLQRPNGTTVREFRDGQVETVQRDGTITISYPDKTSRFIFPTGEEENIFADGTIYRVDKTGKKIVEFRDGTREIYWSDMKQRIETDGTIRTVYPDGTRETKYPNGQVRIMDPTGRIQCGPP